MPCSINQLLIVETALVVENCAVSLRRILFLLAIILILVLLQPRESWAGMRKMWSQRGWILSVLVAGLTLYLFYGLYSLYRQGGIGGF